MGALRFNHFTPLGAPGLQILRVCVNLTCDCVLLGVDGALFFGDEEQPEQVVQKSVSQQDDVGRHEAPEIIVVAWAHDSVSNEEAQLITPLTSTGNKSDKSKCFKSPPSSFSSLLISMTTNFSHTANVGSVEEMNWPNLSGGTRTVV